MGRQIAKLTCAKLTAGMLGHMLRLRPDGSKLTWRVACMSEFDAPGRAPKPFFITWDDPTIRPDKVRVAPHPPGYEGPTSTYKQHLQSSPALEHATRGTWKSPSSLCRFASASSMNAQKAV